MSQGTAKISNQYRYLPLPTRPTLKSVAFEEIDIIYIIRCCFNDHKGGGGGGEYQMTLLLFLNHPSPGKSIEN